MEEMHRTRYVGRHSTLATSPSVHQPGKSPNPILWVFNGSFLSSHDWLNHCHWWLAQPPAPSPPWRSEVGLKNSITNHMIGSIGNQPPFLQMLSKSQLINITKDTFLHSQHLGHSKSSGRCEPGIVDKDKIDIAYKSQYCKSQNKISQIPSSLIF